jgi:hypothetical protein
MLLHDMKIATNPCRVCTMILALLRVDNAMVTLMVRVSLLMPVLGERLESAVSAATLKPTPHITVALSNVC